ncbi:hypothetical protein BKP37_13995 [Anaerobacillus alkalilacustris]|uniref:Uncharacterized protein n=1 Tax=Anaerobacillus alkalilacustris TaxID=393763 RepID=A0A1S2LJQ3_9BACI|nr:YppG family protein [Anaerobacillus alkalilacustris]OIJ12534.1 hypothetical protein BKP37_13995 [Anaerobacillus alkalilacustris]
MFPQRSHMYQQPPHRYHYSYYQQHPYGYQEGPRPKGLFGKRRQLGTPIEHQQMPPPHFYHQPNLHQYYSQQLMVPQSSFQQPKKGIFHNHEGKLDFQKIGNGVQTAMGFVNQVSPVMKMFGGLFK